MTVYTAHQQTSREIPQDFNGYVSVARPALRITADQVRRGDFMITDGYVVRVYAVTAFELSNGVSVVHIQGDLNMVRGTHELVSVLR